MPAGEEGDVVAQAEATVEAKEGVAHVEAVSGEAAERWGEAEELVAAWTEVEVQAEAARWGGAEGHVAAHLEVLRVAKEVRAVDISEMEVLLAATMEMAASEAEATEPRERLQQIRPACKETTGKCAWMYLERAQK